MLRLIVPGADYSALNIGYFGEEMPYSPYAFWLTGSYFNGALTPRDQSGNNRHLTKVGAPVISPYWAQTAVSANQCFEAPFILSLIQATSHQLTMIALVKVASTANWPYMGDSNTLPNVCSMGGTATAEVQVVLNSGTSRLDQFSPADVERGNRWTMYTGVYTYTSVEAFKRHALLSSTLTNGPTTFAAETTMGNATRSLRIGGDYINSGLGGGLVAAALVYTTALTPTQLDAIYARLQTILNPFGFGL